MFNIRLNDVFLYLRRVNAAPDSILLGAKGSASSSSITTLAREAVKNDYRGIMVW